MSATNQALIRDYLRAIEEAVPKERIEAFLHPDIVQHEFPSRLNPNGKTRNQADLLEDYERGKAIIARQEYRIKSLISDGDRVAAETEWTGVLGIPLGTLRAGEALKADFGVFFRIRDGRIAEQNNYDCIHPW